MKKKKRVSKFVQIFDYKMLVYDFVKWTGAIPVLCDLRMKRVFVKDGKVAKKTKGLFKGSFLISSNHISFIDAVILSNAFWERRVGFIATTEIFQVKFWGPFFKRCGCIPINKENISMKTFKEIQERFDRGHTVAIFPEGKITPTQNQFTQFKAGAILVALYTKVPIIPIYIEKRTKRRKRQRVFIGEKLDLSKYCNEEIPSLKTVEELSQLLREKEIELEELAQGITRKKEKKDDKVVL